MYIARVLYPVEVLGPGKRIGIWMSGCAHMCKGCSNPELWRQHEKHNISMGNMGKLIESICSKYDVDGFTLTGGDPFYQPEALKELLPYLYIVQKDILVYTGYEYGFIKAKYGDLLKYIAVLIDGKYEEEKNKGAVLRGSDNQNIYYLNEEYRTKYQAYLEQKTSKIQNFHTADGVISVGIHLPGYEERLKELVSRKGLEEV